MKKLFSILIVCLLAITSTACGSEETTKQKEVEKPKVGKKEEKKAEKPKEEKKDVKITDDAINFAKDTIGGYDQVKESLIEVKGDKVTMVIVVGAATNEETAKELGDNFVRALSTAVNLTSDVKLKAPDKESLGELWNYFNLQIGVGSGPDNFIAQGAKAKNARKIMW